VALLNLAAFDLLVRTNFSSNHPRHPAVHCIAKRICAVFTDDWIARLLPAPAQEYIVSRRRHPARNRQMVIRQLTRLPRPIPQFFPTLSLW